MFFSIVMPCFNVADSIEHTIRTVCEQTFTDFELLAVDDGSTDETIQIARDHARQHLPASAEFRVISQENHGPGAARNRGMREARGEFIAFLDADDLWSPEYLARVAAAFENLPRLEALATNSWDLLPDGYHLNVRPANDCVEVIEDFFEAMHKKSVIPRTSGIAIRRSVIERVGYMREDLLRSQDREYWARLAASRICWGFSPEPLVVYNGLRGQSVTRNELRFTRVPSPEKWSSEIWPLLDSDTQSGFRKLYMARAKNLCRECLQAGLDDQARATAREALSRTKLGCDTFFFMAVSYAPGGLYRLTWPAGSRAKSLLRKALRMDRPASKTPEPPDHRRV